MNKQIVNAYTVDDIHDMRVRVAEQYRKMTPAEAERDFKACVENAKKTMAALRKQKQLTLN